MAVVLKEVDKVVRDNDDGSETRRTASIFWSASVVKVLYQTVITMKEERLAV